MELPLWYFSKENKNTKKSEVCAVASSNSGEKSVRCSLQKVALPNGLLAFKHNKDCETKLYACLFLE
jgi:hypothetical protein